MQRPHPSCNVDLYLFLMEALAHDSNLFKDRCVQTFNRSEKVRAPFINSAKRDLSLLPSSLLSIPTLILPPRFRHLQNCHSLAQDPAMKVRKTTKLYSARQLGSYISYLVGQKCVRFKFRTAQLNHSYFLATLLFRGHCIARRPFQWCSCRSLSGTMKRSRNLL